MAARVLTPLGLFALALAVRLLPWPTVIEPGRVVYFGMDAWYHMRRVQIALASLPTSAGWPPAFDPYLNFPHGGMPIWPPLFDAGVAWFVWPFGAVGGWLAAERAAAILPPILGALCVVVVYRLGLRLFDRTIAVVAATGLCFLSAHFWYSQIGFVDHHVAVALAATSLLAWAANFVDRLTDGGDARGSAVATGLLCGVCLSIWPGTVLHVGVVVLGVGVAWLARPGAAASRSGARMLALSAGVALLVVAPLGWFAGWDGARAFSPTVLSRFQPWMFAVLIALAAICMLASRGGWFGETPGRRATVALATGLALVGASLVAIPELTNGVEEAWRWFTRDEVFQGLVRESKPLFASETGIDPHNAELRLSRLLYLLPVALAALAWRSRDFEHAPAIRLLVAWTLTLGMATLLQRRFFNSLSPVFALVMAWAVVTSVRRIPAWWVGASPATLRTVQAGVIVLALGLYAPTLAAYAVPAKNFVHWLRGETMVVPKPEISRRVLLDTALWLNENTPPTSGPLDPTSQPAYGVMAPWGYGHLLKYAARRPTVVGNFGDDVGGDNLRRSNAYFASREADASQILDDLRARYVLVRSLGDVPPDHLRGQAMRKRLSQDDSPGLARHRLVYESPLDTIWAGIGRSEFRVFEHVAGARLVGEAAPGAVVVARLGYTSNRGRRGRFESRATAGPDGRYEIRVPYANRGAPPGVQADPSYAVSAGGRVVPVPVLERDVRSGARVDVPSLR